MDMIQLIYASRPFGYDTAILSGILLDARRGNSHDGITGALLCRRDIYLQLLEGPRQRVSATYERILRDDRHANIIKLLTRPISERLFADWDMLHDPAQSLHWSSKTVADGALQRATTDEIHEVFASLSAKVRA